MVKKIEMITDPYNENNFSSIKNFVTHTRNIKKLTRKEIKAISKAAKDVSLTSCTRDWIKGIRYKIKAIRFDLKLIIDYVTSKEHHNKKL